MPMSGYEQRRWRELEAQLARERRLVRLAHRLEPPRVGAGFPSRASVLWATGGCLGLALAVVGAMMHNTTLNIAGVAILAATLVLVGAALIVSGIGRSRRERRTAPNWQAHPPTR